MLCFTSVDAQQEVEKDYLENFSASFTEWQIGHRATNYFWSLCLGLNQELTNEELGQKFNALINDSANRVAFYKRFNYYLSGRLRYYPDLLLLYKEKKGGKEGMNRPLYIPYQTIEDFAKIVHSYGQDIMMAAAWQAEMETKQDTTKKDTLVHLEEYPKFPGGESGMIKFLSKHVIYPQNEFDNDITGKVILRFIVCDDGYVCSAKAIRGVSENIDAEAIRVLKMMPHWQPGKLDGKPVKVHYILPISFNLQ